jgi:hypothetical protein
MERKGLLIDFDHAQLKDHAADPDYVEHHQRALERTVRSVFCYVNATELIHDPGHCTFHFQCCPHAHQAA